MERCHEAVKLAHGLSLSLRGATKPWLKGDAADLALELRRAALWIPMDLADVVTLNGQRRVGASLGALESLSSAAGSIARVLYLLRLASDLGYSRGADLEALSAEATVLAGMIDGWRAELNDRLDRPDSPTLN